DQPREHDPTAFGDCKNDEHQDRCDQRERGDRDRLLVTPEQRFHRGITTVARTGSGDGMICCMIGVYSFTRSSPVTATESVETTGGATTMSAISVRAALAVCK